MGLGNFLLAWEERKMAPPRPLLMALSLLPVLIWTQARWPYYKIPIFYSFYSCFRIFLVVTEGPFKYMPIFIGWLLMSLTIVAGFFAFQEQRENSIVGYWLASFLLLDGIELARTGYYYCHRSETSPDLTARLVEEV